MLPDDATERQLDIARVWGDLRDLRRQRVEVIPMRRRDFDVASAIAGELAETVVREGRVVYFAATPVRAALPPHIGQPVSAASLVSIATRRPSSVPT